MKNILMIGYLVDTESFKRYTPLDSNPQVAARKLESAYLEGFVKNQKNVAILSFFPATTYPGCKKILFGIKNFGRNRWCLPFVNFFGLKGFTKFLASYVGVVCARFSNIKPDIICVYSAHTPYLLASVLAKITLGIDFIVIIPDLPMMMRIGSNSGRIIRALKFIDSCLVNFSLRFATCFSCITKYMPEALHITEQKPFVVIEGLLSESLPEPDSKDSLKKLRSSSRDYFLYTGGLNADYGVDTILESFVNSACDVDLVFCGSGLLTDKIRQLAAVDDRIFYMGYLDQQSVRYLQRNALALLLIRDDKSQFVKYSFPSKLIEYMSSGVPVICSRLPGIPDEYYNCLIELDGLSKTRLTKLFNDPTQFKTPESLKRALEAQKFISQRCNPESRVSDLLQLILANY